MSKARLFALATLLCLIPCFIFAPNLTLVNNESSSPSIATLDVCNKHIAGTVDGLSFVVSMLFLLLTLFSIERIAETKHVRVPSLPWNSDYKPPKFA
ncbi:MAG: hypothetical protein HQL10_05060 [Nitrospirae bacterium]|nr:hypothetical protein [Nitrospirota bacterium]